MFTVIELQTTNGTTVVLTSTFEDENSANQKYHQILSYAAVSELDVHAATILDQYGSLWKSEYYEHKKEDPEEPTT